MTGPEIGQRIQLLRGDMSQTAFANLLEISRSSLLRYEKGERLPDGAVLRQMCVKLGANGHWLLTGEGEVYTSEEVKPGVTRSQKGSSSNGLLEVWESAVDREFSLGSHRAAAQTASHRSAWKVLAKLRSVYPNGSDIAELNESMTDREVGERALEASLFWLLQAGIIEEVRGVGQPSYRMIKGLGTLSFRDDPETSAAVITALELLLDTIVPGVAERRGKLVTAEVRIPKGKGREVATSILKQVRAEFMKGMESEGVEERVSLILGVAVDDGEVLDS